MCGRTCREAQLCANNISPATLDVVMQCRYDGWNLVRLDAEDEREGGDRNGVNLPMAHARLQITKHACVDPNLDVSSG